MVPPQMTTTQGPPQTTFDEDHIWDTKQ